MNPTFPTARCFWEVMWMFYDRSPGRLRTVVDFTITAIMRSKNGRLIPVQQRAAKRTAAATATDCLFWLIPPFFPVVLDAEHLTVVCLSLAALVPRRNMVCFHLLDLEGVAAVRTYALLPLKR